jgi:hypothetical protein
VYLLVFVTKASRLRHHVHVLLELAERGHEIEIVFSARDGGQLDAPLAGAAGVRTTQLERGWDPATSDALRTIRQARDYLRFLEPPLDTAASNRARALDRLLATAPALSALRGWGALADVASLRTLIRTLEAAIPPDPAVASFVAERAPDAVLVTPLLSLGSPQIEAVKAARAAGVPSGVLVFSWDSLSNKGEMGAIPDRIFVWNELQKREAIELHGVPAEAVVTTGAPRFDEFFDLAPSVTREELCARHGLDPERPIVVYLASAPTISTDERPVVERWLTAVRSSPDQRVREAGALLRPHPHRRTIWEDWVGPAQPPIGLSERPTVSSDQSLFDELYHADAAVGLNTSAELEASIVGTPVLTFDCEDAPGQHGSAHFAYLLKENGGVVEHAASLDDHVGQLANVLGGGVDSDAIRAFVGWFIRPHGLERPATPILADAIESLAARPLGGVRFDAAAVEP